MYQITESIPLPSTETKEKILARKAVNNLIKRYQDAYRAVYGKTPEVNYTDPWFKVETQKARVTSDRLKEMARNLEDRAQ